MNHTYTVASPSPTCQTLQPVGLLVRHPPFKGFALAAVHPAVERAVDRRACRLSRQVGLPPIRGGLSAALDIPNDDTWRITFADINQYLGPFKVQTKLFDQASPEVRLWRITYLDESLRIMRAKKEGDADEDAFIFVLRRAEEERFALGQL